MIYGSGIHGFLITKKGHITAGSPASPYGAGIKTDGQFSIKTVKDGTDDRNRNLRNLMQFAASFKSFQITLEDLYMFFSVYCADHGVDAQVVFKEKNVGGYYKAWNFHDTGLDDTYFAGIEFDFLLSDAERSVKIDLGCAVEYAYGKQLVDLLQVAQIHSWLLDTNNGLGSKGIKFSKQIAPYFLSIENPSGTALLSKPDLKSRRLNIKTAGNTTAYERRVNDWIEVEFEVVTHDVTDINIWRVVNKAQEGSMKLIESVSATKTEQYIFPEGALTFKPEIVRGDDTSEVKILAAGKFPPSAISADYSDTNNVKLTFNA